MRLITFILLLGIPWASLAQKGDTLRKYLNESLEYVPKDDAAFAAMAIKSGDYWFMMAVYPDTSILLKAYFKDKKLSIKEGPFTLYYPKGLKATEGNYSNNIRQGVWKYYHRNGQLKDSGMFKNNNMVNTWYSWHENGQLASIAEYASDNTLPDIYTTDKATRTPGVQAEDPIVIQKEGNWKSYYPNGNLKDSGRYKKATKDGYWVSWYENGTLESKGTYYFNSQEGEWHYFHENGQPSTIETYKNNKLTNMECFDENGKPSGSFCSILNQPSPYAMSRFTSFDTYVVDNLFWPKELDGKDVNGLVVVSYTITKEGKMTGFKVLQSPHELLSKETERFFRSIEKWYPAISHNRTIDYPVTLSIPFYR